MHRHALVCAINALFASAGLPRMGMDSDSPAGPPRAIAIREP